MSQLPPALPPSEFGVGPEDFAPPGVLQPNQRAYPEPPRRARRWLTVAAVLAALMLAFWIFVGSALFSVMGSAAQPRKVAQEFVQRTSEGAIEAALEHVGRDISREQVVRLSERMAWWGAFVGLASSRNSIKVQGSISTCEVGGTATFADGEHGFDMVLMRVGKTWRVTMVEFE